MMRAVIKADLSFSAGVITVTTSKEQQMSYVHEYSVEQPLRSDIDALAGSVALEFGTAWCGHCQAAQSAIKDALGGRPDVRHLKVEDGSGRALGRSFKVKLWPTVILLKDGVEVDRLVRPTRLDELNLALQRLT
jgi:thioredoxin 1